MEGKLSERLVTALLLPETGNSITYFSGHKLQGLTAPRGFGVRCTKNGRAFVLNYRIDGLERRYTIGQHPDWSVIAAVKEAKRLRQQIDRGDDPQKKKAEKRDASTIKELCQRFLDEHVVQLRGSTQRDYKALVAIIRDELGSQKIEAIERQHISKMHRARQDTPFRANRLSAVASAMFAFAVTEKLRADNPAKGIKRFSEDGRERYLSPEELIRLTDALAAYPKAHAAKVAARAGEDARKARENARTAAQRACDVVRLCLLTGCRKGEALSAKWPQFDLSRKTWTKPSAHTKQNKVHVAPLSDAAVILLNALHERAPKDDNGDPVSACVFPGDTPAAPLSTIKAHWHNIREMAGLPDFRVHDCRHNFASLLASAGASLPMIGRLLGHTQQATTARYVHLFADPLQRAATAAGAIITGQSSADVTPIRKDGAA